MQLLLATAHLLMAGLIARLSVQGPQAHARVQFTPPFGDHQNHMDLTNTSNRIPKWNQKCNFWLQLQIRKKFGFVAIIHTDIVQQIL